MRREILKAVCASVTLSFALGCGQAPSTKSESNVNKQAAHKDHTDGDEHDHKADAKSGKEHDHSGWWCNEHGVPEEICSLCNSKVAGELQKKGDWCKEHNRADSQCFICHPELEEKFAAQYEAKFGKKPPKPEIN